jgi:hypothetical protein
MTTSPDTKATTGTKDAIDKAQSRAKWRRRGLGESGDTISI